jgi:hypothetical protein
MADGHTLALPTADAAPEEAAWRQPMTGAHEGEGEARSLVRRASAWSRNKLLEMHVKACISTAGTYVCDPCNCHLTATLADV